MKKFIDRIMFCIYYHLYHTFAFAYNNVALFVSSGEWFNWVKQTLKYVDKSSIVLEIGFGTGLLFDEITKLGNEIFGIDESQKMIDLTKKRLNGIHDEPKIVRGNAKNLPYPAEFFDLIITTFPGEFMFDELFLMEIERTLKRGGKFISLLGVSFNKSTVLDLFFRSINLISNQKVDIDHYKKYFAFSNGNGRTETDYISQEYKDRSLYFLIIKKL